MKEYVLTEGDEKLQEIIKNDCFLSFAQVTFESAKKCFVEQCYAEMMAFLIRKLAPTSMPYISSKEIEAIIIPGRLTLPITT